MKREPVNEPPDDSEDPEINERELEVLALLPTKLTYAEIGKKLCMPDRTVEWHVANLFEKTDTHQRHALVVWGIKHGLIRDL